MIGGEFSVYLVGLDTDIYYLKFIGNKNIVNGAGASFLFGLKAVIGVGEKVSINGGIYVVKVDVRIAVQVIPQDLQGAAVGFCVKISH